MEPWMCVLGGIMLGVLIGYALAVIIRSQKTVGTLRVDQSIPDEAPYLFLELEQDGMTRIRKSKTVLFHVNLENYMTRK